jgi:hypothetical protein
MRKLVSLSAVAMALALAPQAFAAPEGGMSKIWESTAKAQIASHPEAVVYDAASAMEFMRSVTGDWALETNAKVGYGDAHSNGSNVRTIAAGSTVMETFLGGSPYEMTNMFHMDGPDKLLMDHFCAARNVPHSEFVKTGKPGEIKFIRTGGTNMDAAMKNQKAVMLIQITGKDQFMSTAAMTGGDPIVTRYKRAEKTAAAK